MFESGFIKLYRSFLGWEWYTDLNTKNLFLHLLLTVNHKDEKWQGIVIKRGQRTISVVKLSREIRLTERQTRTALSHLILTNEVTSTTTTKHTLFTVNNYEKYQTATNEMTNERQTNDKQNDKQNDKRPTSDRQATDKPSIYKEIQEVQEIQEVKEMRHQYGEYKNVLLTDTEIIKLKEEIPNWDEYLEKLSGYMKSTGKSYKDYLATLRNWARKDGANGRTSDIGNVKDTDGINAGGIILR